MLGAIFLARSLSSDGFAAYGYFQMTIAMLAAYATMGLGVTAARLFSEVGHTEENKLPPLGTMMILGLILASSSFVLILILPTSLLDGGLPVPQWLLALGVSMAIAGIVPGGGILGLEKYRPACLVSLFSAACILLLTILAASRSSPTIGMWSIIAAFTVQTIGQTVVLIRATGWKTLVKTSRWTLSDLRNIGSFTGPMAIVTILAASANWVLGRLILADSGETQFALYTIGLQWLSLGLLLPGMVSRVILPRVVRTRGENSRLLVRQAVVMTLVSSGLMVVGGFAFAQWLMNLYGPEYGYAAYVIPAYLFIALLSAPINTLGNAIVANDGQWRWLQLTFIWFLGLIVAMLFIAPKRDVSWATISHVAAATVFLILTWIDGRRKNLI